MDHMFRYAYMKIYDLFHSYVCVFVCMHTFTPLSMYIHTYIQNTCTHTGALLDTVADEVYRFTNIYTEMRDLGITS